MYIASDGQILFSHAIKPSGECAVFATHSHAMHECMLFLHGNITATYGDVTFQPKPNSMMLTPQGVPHSLIAEKSMSYERFVLHFTPELLPDSLRDALETLLFQEAHYIEDAVGLLPDLYAMEECLSMPDSIRYEAARARLIALLTRTTLRCAKASKLLSSQSIISSVLEYIHINIHEPQLLSMDALSQRFYISKSQLNKLFTRKTGVSLAKYIRTRRYEYAETLRAQGMSAVEAAAKAGYQCYTTYYRIHSHDPAENLAAETP